MRINTQDRRSAANDDSSARLHHRLVGPGGIESAPGGRITTDAPRPGPAGVDHAFYLFPGSTNLPNSAGPSA